MPSHPRRDHYSWKQEQPSTSGRAFQGDNGQRSSSASSGSGRGKASKFPARKPEPFNRNPAASGGKAYQPSKPFKDSKRQFQRK